MYITNITDKGTEKVKAKVIGITKDVSLMPGDRVFIPDDLVYVDEFDRFGKPTGRKIVSPALQAQERVGLIKIEETAKKTDEEAPAKPVSNESDEEVSIAAEDAEARKKAEAAAKRAATRAANKAAKEAAGE